MRVGVIGTRGFPDIQGGIETHCHELYTRLAQLEGNQITVYRRVPYLSQKNKYARFKNIRFVDINVPKNKFLETFLHSFLSTLHALFQKYDVIHFHNTGPGIFIPLARLTGARIVLTYHNVSYTQQKWNSFARWFLALSESVSMRKSDFVIFISEIIRNEMHLKYKIPIGSSSVIFNGVRIPVKSVDDSYIKQLGIERNGYILAVGRLLEEKGFDYLIRAYKKASPEKIKLVLAGDTDYPTVYSDKLKKMAAEHGIIMPGFVKGEELNQLFSFARLFVISSYSEGLPIALLEAMSYDLDVLASDIPANLQVGLAKDDYFITGDEVSLAGSLMKKLARENKKSFSEVLSERYNWEGIVIRTAEIYNKLLN